MSQSQFLRNFKLWFEAGATDAADAASEDDARKGTHNALKQVLFEAWAAPKVDATDLLVNFCAQAAADDSGEAFASAAVAINAAVRPVLSDGLHMACLVAGRATCSPGGSLASEPRLGPDQLLRVFAVSCMRVVVVIACRCMLRTSFALTARPRFASSSCSLLCMNSSNRCLLVWTGLRCARHMAVALLSWSCATQRLPRTPATLRAARRCAGAPCWRRHSACRMLRQRWPRW